MGLAADSVGTSGGLHWRLRLRSFVVLRTVQDDNVFSSERTKE
jgi:hypothetical protein